MGKTGFEKFTAAQMDAPVVKPGARAAERVRAELPKEEPAPVKPAEPAPQPVQVPARKAGRPKADPAIKKEQHRTTLDIDVDVMQKLEQMKYVLHKSTVKAVIMTAIEDLFEKHGMR